MDQPTHDEERTERDRCIDQLVRLQRKLLRGDPSVVAARLYVKVGARLTQLRAEKREEEGEVASFSLAQY